jgi:hypothetical protein
MVAEKSSFFICHGLDPMTCMDSELVLKRLILSRNPLTGVRPIHRLVSGYVSTAQKKKCFHAPSWIRSRYPRLYAHEKQITV